MLHVSAITVSIGKPPKGKHLKLDKFHLQCHISEKKRYLHTCK